MNIGGADRWVDWDVCEATKDFVCRWIKALWPEAVLRWAEKPEGYAPLGELFASRDQATADLTDKVGITDETGPNNLYIQFGKDGFNITYMHNDPKWDKLIDELVMSVRANIGLI